MRPELLRAALTHDDRLDDIKRVQIWQRVEAKLSEQLPTRSWRAFALVASSIAAAALIAVVLASPWCIATA
jgi:hypothetical protein